MHFVNKLGKYVFHIAFVQEKETNKKETDNILDNVLLIKYEVSYLIYCYETRKLRLSVTNHGVHNTLTKKKLEQLARLFRDVPKRIYFKNNRKNIDYLFNRNGDCVVCRQGI